MRESQEQPPMFKLLNFIPLIYASRAKGPPAGRTSVRARGRTPWVYLRQ